MVTLQILVLPFLVRVRVSQQRRAQSFIRLRFFLHLTLRYRKSHTHNTIVFNFLNFFNSFNSPKLIRK